ILVEYPIVNPIELKHWSWVANYYMCTLGEVFRGVLPGAFWLQRETLILRTEQVHFDDSSLLDDDSLVVEALQNQSIRRVQDISDIVDKRNVLPILNRLLEKNIIVLKEEIYEQYRPKMVRYVRLGKDYALEEHLVALLDSMARAPKQRQVVLA